MSREDPDDHDGNGADALRMCFWLGLIGLLLFWLPLGWAIWHWL